MSRSPETRDGTASAVPPSATDRPTGERPGDGAPSGDGDSRRMPRWAPSSLLRWARRCAATLVRLTSLRLRLIMVFGLVALTAAVSVSGIAYWLNRDAVLTRAQNLALDDFHQALGHYAGSLPPRPGCAQLRGALEEMAPTTLSYEVVLTDVQTNGEPCVTASAPARFVAVLVVPLLAAVAWGLFGTPGDAAGRPGRPPVPVPGRVRLLLEALVLFGGAVLLAVSGQGWWAVALTGALVAYHVAAWDRVRWLLLPAAGPRRPNATDPTAR